MFAIDWVQIRDNRLFTGDGTHNEDYPSHGVEVHAVADATVERVRDGQPEETPHQPPAHLRLPQDYSGNAVVLRLAPWVWATYAHLQPGSITVKLGEHVGVGAVLGRLGNTGNSTAPHLHFQLSDGPEVLTANSVPFVIDRFEATALTPDSTETDMRTEGPPQPISNALPLDLTIQNFR